MQSHVVEYFTSAKAIDALVNDSPWSKVQYQLKNNFGKTSELNS